MTERKQPEEGAPAQLDLTDLDSAQEAYARLREQGTVVRATVGLGGEPGERPRGFEGFFVGRYEDVLATLLDDRFSTNFESAMSPEQLKRLPPIQEELRPVMHSLISVDPPDHTRLRKLVQPIFTPRALEGLRPRIQQLAEQLLDDAEREAAERGEVRPDRRMDLIASFAYPLPVTVISEMLGIPPEDRDRVHAWTENLLAVDRRRGGTLDAEGLQKLRELIAYLRDLFAVKRQKPAEDLTSQLVHAQEDGDKLNEDELLSMVFLLYLAGHVTTVNLVGNAVLALLSHPDQLARLKADSSLVHGAVEETLRYWGPVDVITRRIARHDLELFGTHMAKGELAMLGLAAANRDPRRFSNPDTFDITRPDADKHLAFGKGIHICLGAPLARMEGQVALATLFRRLPELRLAVPPEDVHWGRTFLRGLGQLPVLF